MPCVQNINQTWCAVNNGSFHKLRAQHGPSQWEINQLRSLGEERSGNVDSVERLMIIMFLNSPNSIVIKYKQLKSSHISPFSMPTNANSQLSFPKKSQKFIRLIANSNFSILFFLKILRTKYFSSRVSNLVQSSFMLDNSNVHSPASSYLAFPLPFSCFTGEGGDR